MAPWLAALPAVGALSLFPPSALEGRDRVRWAAWASAALDVAPPPPDGVVTLREPGAEMLLVPAGAFDMGSTDADVLAAAADCQKEPDGQRCEPTLFADETPKHRVRLSAYWLDRTEVTVAAYTRCTELGRCAPLPLDGGAARFGVPDFPVSLVTWDEASAYCATRGARLPTEAEFERAARGPSGRTYPWGFLYHSRASNHGRLAWEQTDPSDGYAELAKVGSFPAGRTKDGFLDLAGNVSEWVSDRYAPSYEGADSVDPRGPPAASPARVVRGGSYVAFRASLRGASRSYAEPSSRRPWLGFRCARSARPSAEPAP